MNADTTPAGRHTLSEQQLDAAIDTVARDMTHAEPSGALRARVFDRIERGRRLAAPGVPKWAWSGAVAAVVLAVATAVWIAGRPPSQPEEATRFAASPPPTMPAQPAAASNLDGQPRAAVRAQATPAASQLARRRPSAPSSAPEREIEPPGAMPALRIEPISGSPPIWIDTVSIETLGIPELTIQPLQIGPLEAGRGTTGDSDR
jgi:hypothetical protein